MKNENNNILNEKDLNRVAGGRGIEVPERDIGKDVPITEYEMEKQQPNETREAEKTESTGQIPRDAARAAQGIGDIAGILLNSTNL